jgi:cytochrome P450
MTVTGSPDKAVELLAWLRMKRESEPVSHDPETGMYHVFRYADVLETLTNHPVFSSDVSEFLPAREELAVVLSGNFVRMDPPCHQQLRGLVSHAFTPRAVAGLAPMIESITARLLDAAGQDRFDLIADLAHPLPLLILGDVLGLLGDNTDLLARFSHAVVFDDGIAGFLDEEVVDGAAPVLGEMRDYLLEQIQRSRKKPGSKVLDGLVRAEIDGKKLTDAEIIGLINLVLTAGHVTTTAALGNALLCLDEHPEVMTELRADPGLLPGAFEETLRTRPPFRWGTRITRRDVHLGGREIPAGSMLAIWLASANHDEARFTAPDAFDIRRSPNPHLSLGQGIHFCLGAPLARLEAQIVLRQLLDRFAEIHVVTDEVEYYAPESVQATRVLPLKVTAK